MGRGGGRGRGGYDWRKHVRPSADPVVQDEINATIKQFLDSGSMQKEISCGGEVRNTYKQYCKQLGVGWARGSRRGSYKLIRLISADPSLTMWKKVWCFYFSHYCDVDLIAEAGKNVDDNGIDRAEQSSNDGVYDIDMDEAAAILRLQENNDDDCNDSGVEDESEATESKNKVVLDSTSKSFDGKRMWTKVRDLLMYIKHNNNQLWEECCSLGVNNCSERKLEPHMEKVQQFFELQGRGPNQKIRGKKLRVEIGSDESVHFLEAGNSFVIEYAKPVKFCDSDAITSLIQLVDKANCSLGINASSKRNKPQKDTAIIDEGNLPSNIFNDNWRRTRRNFELGERLHNDSIDPIFHERKNSLRKRLPAFKIGNEFCKRVFENDVVVLCGATGSGKSTQLPQMLMEAAAKLHSTFAKNDERQFGTGRIICTQPRRISATSVAERVCFERNERMGDRVGYQIRFEQRATDTTELLYCTTGILLRFLVGNPKLEGVSCVILDEVHERGTHSDFVLLILKDLILERKGSNEPLKAVLMSATIDASNFLEYFDPGSSIKFNNMSIETFDEIGTVRGATENPIAYAVSFLQIEGKTNYPIEEYFIEDIIKEVPSLAVRGPPPMSTNRGGRNNGMVQELRNHWASPDAVRSKYNELGLKVKSDNRGVWRTLSNILQRPFKLDVDLICKVVEHIEGHSENEEDGTLGAILIFVPGWQDITSVIKALEKTIKNFRKQHAWALNRSWNILPLHSMVSQRDQQKIFYSESPYSGRRKIIVSTSLAETSITIEDVVYVVDPGLMKSTTYSAHTNIASLETMQISRSNVQQRRGRAGRCRPGQFYKLYSQYEYLHEMRDHELPEMLRTPVEELCLQAKALRLPGDLHTQQILSKAIDPPEILAVGNAVQLLTELGAFDSNESMTPLGWNLCQLPIHPCLGKMLLLGSLFTRYSSRGSNSKNILLPLISICSTLSFKSPFVLPFGKEKEADHARKNYGQGLFSDHLLFAKVLGEYANLKSSGSHTGEALFSWLDKNFISKKTLEQSEKIEQELKRHLKDLKVNDASDFIVGNDEGKLSHDELISRPLLSAILAASLSISFTSPTSQKLCSLQGGSACSVHPSSLLSMIESAGNERTLWKQALHLLRSQCNDEIVKKFVLDCPDKIFILGWFERLKTSQLYLRDCTLFSDPLPLLLFLPGVKQRGINSQKKSESFPFSEDSTIFEVIGGKSSEGGDSHKQTKNKPTLLLKAQDEAIAQLLNILRIKLSGFFGAVLSKGMHSSISGTLEDDTRAVFSGLEALIEQSHALYMSDARHPSENGKETKDRDVLEVRYLHASAHCDILDHKSDDHVDGGIDADDEVDDYGYDRCDARQTGSSGRDQYSRQGRGRAKRGRGNSCGRRRHGGGKGGKGSRW
ncbi:hypothetical protein ACHAXR_012593 [Thalassiosira sp. AJA248-18]